MKSKKSKSKSPFFEIEKLIKDIDKQLRETGEYKEKKTLKKKLQKLKKKIYEEVSYKDLVKKLEKSIKPIIKK